MAKPRKLPAIPPNDYSGSVAAWCTELITRGLWNGEGWYGDVMITRTVYNEILNNCE